MGLFTDIKSGVKGTWALGKTVVRKNAPAIKYFVEEGSRFTATALVAGGNIFSESADMAEVVKAYARGGRNELLKGKTLGERVASAEGNGGRHMRDLLADGEQEARDAEEASGL